MVLGKRNMASSIRYHRINKNSEDDYVDAQFQQTPANVPYKAIALAIFLCVMGTILLIVGSLLLSGYIDVKYADRTYPVIILGALLFIPGIYHVRIAVYAWRGYMGYSYSDIPDFN